MKRFVFRTSLLSLFGVLAVIALPQLCYACSCVAMSPPAGGWTREALLEGNDVVFLGRVVEAGPLRDLGGATDGTYRVTFAASEVWAGPVQQHYVVQAGSGGGDCTISFRIGQEWLIYGYDDPIGIVNTSTCSRTIQNPTTQTEGDLAVLGAGMPVNLEAGTPISIEGRGEGEQPMPQDRSPVSSPVSVETDQDGDYTDPATVSVPSSDQQTMKWTLAGVGIVSLLALTLLVGALLRRRSSISG